MPDINALSPSHLLTLCLLGLGICGCAWIDWVLYLATHSRLLEHTVYKVRCALMQQKKHSLHINDIFIHTIIHIWSCASQTICQAKILQYNCETSGSLTKVFLSNILLDYYWIIVQHIILLLTPTHFSRKYCRWPVRAHNDYNEQSDLQTVRHRINIQLAAIDTHRLEAYMRPRDCLSRLEFVERSF